MSYRPKDSADTNMRWLCCRLEVVPKLRGKGARSKVVGSTER